MLKCGLLYNEVVVKSNVRILDDYRFQRMNVVYELYSSFKFRSDFSLELSSGPWEVIFNTDSHKCHLFKVKREDLSSLFINPAFF